MEKSQPDPAVSGVVVTTSRVLRLAVAAYLARFKSQSRIHTESDLRGYLVWCELRGLDPLAASRPHIELYVRWLQESTPAPAIDGVSMHVGRRRLLPDMRDRRRS
jgi:integrase/recombinase XerD